MLSKLAVLLLVGLIAHPVLAQDEAADAKKEAENKARRAEVLAALDLPKQAKALRDKGVDKDELKKAIREARKKKMKAKETKELLEAADESVRENGPVDNFGAFVRSKLDEGLRGKELAAAIKAEHKARGKGKGWKPGREKADRSEKDRSEKGQKEEPDKGKKGRHDEDGEDEHDGDADVDKGGPDDDSVKGKGKGKGKGKDR